MSDLFGIKALHGIKDSDTEKCLLLQLFVDKCIALKKNGVIICDTYDSFELVKPFRTVDAEDWGNE